MRKWVNKFIKVLMVFLPAVFAAVFCSAEVFAETTVTISNNAGGKVSFGKILPSSTGTVATGQDTLTITTNCAEGVNLYVSAVNGGSTALTNAATSSSIPTVSASIGETAAALSSNTWGLNITGGDTYYGLPAYSASPGTPLYTGTATSLPIYYGVKATSSSAPGSYTGQVLYTAMVNSECLKYTVHFNANGGTGTMTDQKIAPAVATALATNTFERDGYRFLGWSNSADGETHTAIDGVGTDADVEYADGALVTDLAASGETANLYAIWEVSTQYFQNTSCSKLTEGETTTLVDKRDNQEYTVYRIPSNAVYPGTSTVANVAGKCIMTKDLNLGAVASVSGSASTITAQGTMNLSPEDSNFTTPTGSGESISVPTSTTSVTHGTPGSGNNNYTNRQYRIDGTGNYAGRGYYTWGAAMLACPKGWRLPTRDEYNNNDSSWNASTTGISKLVNNNITTIQQSPYSFVLGGYYGSGWSTAGSYGYYWSSTQYNSDYAYYLRMYSSSGLIRNYSYKRVGFVVRCIAE